MNVQNLTNSLVHFHYYHGAIGPREWKKIKKVCCSNIEPIEDCDFTSHIMENTTDSIALDECGKLFVDKLYLNDNQNEYNYYLDCYKPDQGIRKRQLPNSKLKTILQTAVSYS